MTLDRSLTDIQSAALRRLIQRHTGIAISPAKDYLLEARIAKVLRQLGLDSVEPLIQGLQTGNKAMWDAMARHVTTGHTFFLRESEHFAIMLAEIKRLRPDSVRIWVAASSSGEEVYSIAMTLLNAKIRNFQILASDINREHLLQVKQGIYTEDRFGHLPEDWRKTYFKPAGFDQLGQVQFQATTEIRSHILVKRLNLLDLLKFEVSFEFIFCRNVFMYFQRDTQAQVLGTLLQNLRAEGTLFMGESENLLGLPTGLVSPWPGVYRRKS